MIFYVLRRNSLMMSAIEDPVKPASALPCAVLKSKNVAKKSTAKPALSRNGSFSSGAASPMSYQGSTPASREPSPEKKLNISNGQTNSIDSTIVVSGESSESIVSNVISNGESEDSRKRVLEETDVGTPAKQARSTESPQNTQGDIHQDLVNVGQNVSEAILEENGSENRTAVVNGVAPHCVSDTACAEQNTEDTSIPSKDIPSKGVDNEEVQDSENTPAEENCISHSKEDDNLSADTNSTSDSECCIMQPDTEKPVIKVPPTNSFTLGDREKDTIKEMLAAAVSRVGQECLDACSKNCDSTQVDCDPTTDVPSSGETVKVSTGSVRETDTLSSHDETNPSQDLDTGGDLPHKSSVNADETSKDGPDNTGSPVHDVCSPDNQAQADDPPTSFEDKTSSSEDKRSSEPDDCLTENPPITGENDMAETAAPVESSGVLGPHDQEKHEEDLILLAGEGSDENMDSIDDSLLDDDEPKKDKTVFSEPQSSTVMEVSQPPEDSQPVTHDSPQQDHTSASPNIIEDSPQGVAQTETDTVSATEHLTADNSSKDEKDEVKNDGTVENSVDNVSTVLLDSASNSVKETTEEDGSVTLDSLKDDGSVPLDSLNKDEADSFTQGSTVAMDATEQPSTTCKPDLIPDTCSKRRLSSTDDDYQLKKHKLDSSCSSPLPKNENSSEAMDVKSSSSVSKDSDSPEQTGPSEQLLSEEKMDLASGSESDGKEPHTNLSDSKLESLDSQAVLVDGVKPEEKPDIKPQNIPKMCSNVRISKEALERLVQRRINAILASPNQSQMLSDMQHRIDYLNSQLTKWKLTAKSFQNKISELTVQNRPDRRRAKGQSRHVAIQCEEVKVQAAQGQHISPTKVVQRPVHASDSTPITPTASVSTCVAGGTQTIVVPVASANANGSLTLISPSTLPPASANLNNAQYRQNFQSPPKRTVREMLDSSRADVGPATAPATVSVGSVPQTAGPTDPALAGPVKVIDLTEDEENSPSKTMVPGVLPPNSGLVVKPTGPVNTIPGPAGANIRPGTYLVPMTSGQQILLQSIGVNQQIRTPQGTTLVYTNARPGGGNNQVVVPSPASGTQLIPIGPGQSQIRTGQIIVRQPHPQAPVIQPSPTQPAPVQPLSTGPRPTAPTAIQAKITPKHPAPLPPQPAVKSGRDLKAMAPKPSLKISRVPQGIVLSWNMVLTESHEVISNYQLFAYQEGNTAPSSSLWKKVGEVKALPLPMACTLTQFQEGNKYHFAVRAVDKHHRIGLFSDPSSIHLEASSSTS